MNRVNMAQLQISCPSPSKKIFSCLREASWEPLRKCSLADIFLTYRPSFCVISVLQLFLLFLHIYCLQENVRDIW